MGDIRNRPKPADQIGPILGSPKSADELHKVHAFDHKKLCAQRRQTEQEKFYHESGKDSCKSVWLFLIDSILRVNKNNAQKQIKFKYGRKVHLSTITDRASLQFHHRFGTMGAGIWIYVHI